MTEIVLFEEYSGLAIPIIPFPILIKQSGGKMPDENIIYQNNVKVFETDQEKRKIIEDIFTKRGFKLIADHLTTTFKDGRVVHTYDRLVFESPLLSEKTDLDIITYFNKLSL